MGTHPVIAPDATTGVRLTGIGANIIPANAPSGVSLVTSPTLGTYCRVTGAIYTSTGAPLTNGDNVSTIQFEVRLPNVWNGNYLQYGGAGADGTFATQGVPGFTWASTLSNSPGSSTYSPSGGYVISVTDAGHIGNNSGLINADGSQNVDRRVNFDYRSRHLLPVVVKQVIERYYGIAPTHSFHAGTSIGGRNGVIAAARYPFDFDAIIAAAPAAFTQGSAVLSSIRVSQAQFPGGPGCDAAHLSVCLASQVIPTAGVNNKLPIIANATMSKCDPEDGLLDGILSDPESCSFDPLTDPNLASLTMSQRNVLKTIYSEAVQPRNPGYETSFGPGSTFANSVLGAGTPPTVAPPVYVNGNGPSQFLIYNNPNFYLQGIDLNLYAYDLENWQHCPTPGSPGLGSPCSKFDPLGFFDPINDINLTAFKEIGGPNGTGGKLLIIQGLADMQVPPHTIVKYYKDVIMHMGGLDNTRDFARLFLVPGRTHGTTTVQAAVGAPANVGLDATGTNMGWLKALEDWVATDVPPDSLLGTDTFTPPALPTITRPLCAYPYKAVYTGPAGDVAKIKDAAYFECRFYDLQGLFSPVDNLPVLNEVKAGQSLPVKFSLGGDWGLNIMAVGFPKSEVIACDATVSVNGVDETVSNDESGLQYDPSSDQYKYVWKTNKNWKDSCRQLVIRLNEGTTVRANFTFK